MKIKRCEAHIKYLKNGKWIICNKKALYYIPSCNIFYCKKHLIKHIESGVFEEGEIEKL